MSETATVAAGQPAAAVDPVDPGPRWARIELECFYRSRDHLPDFTVRWDQDCGPGADFSLLRILLLTLATIPDNNVQW